METQTHCYVLVYLLSFFLLLILLSHKFCAQLETLAQYAQLSQFVFVVNYHFGNLTYFTADFWSSNIFHNSRHYVIAASAFCYSRDLLIVTQFYVYVQSSALSHSFHDTSLLATAHYTSCQTTVATYQNEQRTHYSHYHYLTLLPRLHEQHKYCKQNIRG